MVLFHKRKGPLYRLNRVEKKVTWYVRSLTQERESEDLGADIATEEPS